ncbi:hypothetical protein CLIB1423_06S00782 [[Candida] railenensis]|uniref:Uncharacterized protein n=1 Tax=[Candida] railenensis TaxID=45579 RepID=A0A9P0QNV8_9ASCO|nr:hypothetical protein CLIB1423_06S00782 [[Candida] railenensis]
MPLKPTMIYSDARDVSNLPKVDQIRNVDDRISRFYVTLPLMVLSYFHDRAWNNGNRPGILLVTDFTKNEDLLFPKGTPEIFTFGGEKKRLSKEKILSISVSKNLFSSISSSLKQASVVGDEYDFNEYGQCSIDKEKIIANIKFRLKVYDGKIEGSIDSIDGFNILPKGTSNAKVARLQQNFLRELPDDYFGFGSMPPPGFNTAPSIIDVPNKRVKIETKVEYSQIPDSIDEFSQEHREIMNDNDNDNRSQEMEESQLFSQPEAELGQGGEEEEESDNLENQEIHDDLAHQATQVCGTSDQGYDEDNALASTTRKNDQNAKVLHNSALSQIRPPAPNSPTSSYPLSKVFEVEGIMKEIIPQNFVVKPYGRTLKIAPFKLFIESVVHGEARIFELDLITESEICNFLGLKEIEDALESLPIIENLLRNIKRQGDNNTFSKIKMQKKVHTFLSTDVEMNYWTCVTSLEDLLQK